jgi:hypothetical protein
MKSIKTFIISLLILSSCQKEQLDHAKVLDQSPETKTTVTIEQAQAWLTRQPDTGILKKYPIRWEKAKAIKTKTGNRIMIKIPGQPTYQNFKQGYRQLSIQRSPKTNQIEAKFLEIIPDAIYFQGKQKVDASDFTGRILEYDLNYRLLQGKIYDKGTQIGESRPASPLEKAAYKENKDQFRLLGTFEQNPQNYANGKISRAMVIETCAWYQTTYIDAEGVFNVYAERICSYSMYDDGSGGGGSGYNDPGIGTDPPGGGGGGGTQNDPPPPPPSNLPGENQNNVDPKKMMDCFANISDPNAVYQVKLLVVEPLPGTSFNVGPNSFGHVAIQLTKAGSGQLITQTIGYYPTGTGFDKLVSTSTMKDNSDIEYNVSATYYTTADNFKKMTDFIAKPSPNYHYTQNNCATFAYGAAMAANLPVPDPTTQIAVGGYCITPAGMGQALRTEQRNTGSKDISSAGGRASASKGECK